MGHGETLLNAVIGAVVSILLSFTGVSPILGGGVAGYLQAESRRRGALVGALSGLLAAVPFLLLAAFGFAFLLVGGGVGLPGGVELLVILFLILPVVMVWSVGLGGLGGYLGTYIREERMANEST